MQNYNRQFLQF